MVHNNESRGHFISSKTWYRRKVETFFYSVTLCWLRWLFADSSINLLLQMSNSEPLFNEFPESFIYSKEAVIVWQAFLRWLPISNKDLRSNNPMALVRWLSNTANLHIVWLSINSWVKSFDFKRHAIILSEIIGARQRHIAQCNPIKLNCLATDYYTDTSFFSAFNCNSK